MCYNTFEGLPVKNNVLKEKFREYKLWRTLSK